MNSTIKKNINKINYSIISIFCLVFVAACVVEGYCNFYTGECGIRITFGENDMNVNDFDAHLASADITQNSEPADTSVVPNATVTLFRAEPTVIPDTYKYVEVASSLFPAKYADSDTIVFDDPDAVNTWMDQYRGWLHKIEVDISGVQIQTTSNAMNHFENTVFYDNNVVSTSSSSGWVY